MTIQQFIEKAIEGGYDGYPKPFCVECGNYQTIKGGDLFLDPKAWQAVGKVEGWNKNIHSGTGHFQDYKWYMHRLIDHLCEGKDIESFIATL